MLRRLNIDRRELQSMKYAYPCNIALDEEERKATGREAYNVTFPDVPEAITCGWSWLEAFEMAEDCLEVALGIYVEQDEDIPIPGDATNEQVSVAVRPLTAAKLSLYTAMRKHGMTEAALGARLGITEAAARKLCSPDHYSHMSAVERALRAVDLRLMVEAEEESGR